MGVRVCPGCGEQDPFKFGKDRNHPDGLASRCILCTRKKSSASYRRNKTSHAQHTRRNADQRKEENRRFLWEYKLSHPCVDCGERDPRVLQFDHVRGTKKSSITDLAYSTKAPIESLTVEISKCGVRCANCHIRRTWETRGYKEPGGKARKRSRKRLPPDRVEVLRREREQGVSYERLGWEFGISPGTAWRLVNKTAGETENVTQGSKSNSPRD
jgi:hypothetical protein